MDTYEEGELQRLEFSNVIARSSHSRNTGKNAYATAIQSSFVSVSICVHRWFITISRVIVADVSAAYT